MFLDVGLGGFGVAGEAGAERVAGEEGAAFGLGQVGAQARSLGGALDEEGDVLGRETGGEDAGSVAGDAAEERPAVDAGEAQPGLEGRDGAGGLCRAAADRDLAPAGLAAQGDEEALGDDQGPAGARAVAGIRLDVVAVAIEAGDLGAAQPAGEAQEEHGAVAQAPQVVGQGGDHGADVVRRDRVLPHRGAGVAAADAGEDGGDVAVDAVEAVAALRAAPGDATEAALDGGDREAAAGRIPARACAPAAPVAGLRGGELGEVEADEFGAGRVGRGSAPWRRHQRAQAAQSTA